MWTFETSHHVDSFLNLGKQGADHWVRISQIDQVFEDKGETIVVLRTGFRVKTNFSARQVIDSFSSKPEKENTR